jgi:plasmid stabilization system protein ParE
MAEKIIWSAEAYRDLEGIFEFISRDSVAIAISVVERILARIDHLAAFPLMGAKVREWKVSPYRHLIEARYRTIYRVEARGVMLIAIVHGARDLKRILTKKGRRRT